ncbi:hypothetical protein LOK49_LG04G01354 [Camellia lanceoleosa]|uniref:Uncharacterized protein n=1 Tax=Camellia lanceoleosa TaxID=1840588 RepID=A0ACC0HXW2_9ERIC|nr:hypothetical protein LOK49_LG04G01354 [Camellia lanceoleosa]
MQHPCNECKGTGETINNKDRCPQCKGEKVVQEKKVLEVIVEKGMQNGQKITFEGGEAPIDSYRGYGICFAAKGTSEVQEEEAPPSLEIIKEPDFNICTSYLAKEKDLAKIQELHSKEVKSSYDSYLKGLTISKGRCYLEEHGVL